MTRIDARWANSAPSIKSRSPERTTVPLMAFRSPRAPPTNGSAERSSPVCLPPDRQITLPVGSSRTTKSTPWGPVRSCNIACEFRLAAGFQDAGQSAVAGRAPQQRGHHVQMVTVRGASGIQISPHPRLHFLHPDVIQVLEGDEREQQIRHQNNRDCCGGQFEANRHDDLPVSMESRRPDDWSS